MISPETLIQIQKCVGKENYFGQQEHLIAYSYDGTPALKGIPSAAIRPVSVEGLSQLVKLANSHRFSLVPRGSGSGLSGGSVPTENSIIVLMNFWNRILEIDRENMTALIEPGVTTSQLQIEVEKYGLLYPPDPGSASISTIGGNVAENAGGLRGLKYGVTRDYVLGLEVVLPNGEVAWFGSKCVKDVAGYNVKDLMIGSEGTLGFITKILVKLIPKPESVRTMLAFYDSMNDAARSVSAIIAYPIMPATLEFLDKTTIHCVESYAHLGLPLDIDALLLVEVDGKEAVTDDEARKIMEICKANNAREVLSASSVEEASRLRSARKVAFTALARMSPTTILEDATVPRNRIPEMVTFVQGVAKKYGLQFGIFGHAGDGNLHPTCLTDERNPEEMHKSEQAFEEIFKEAIRLGGTITGEHGVGLTKKRYLRELYSPAVIGAYEAVKKAFDPNGIMNPGKII